MARTELLKRFPERVHAAADRGREGPGGGGLGRGALRQAEEEALGAGAAVPATDAAIGAGGGARRGYDKPGTRRLRRLARRAARREYLTGSRGLDLVAAAMEAVERWDGFKGTTEDEVTEDLARWQMWADAQLPGFGTTENSRHDDTGVSSAGFGLLVSSVRLQAL